MRNLDEVLSGLELDSSPLEDAQAAFWESIGRAYPEVTSGDFSPEQTMDFERACKQAVQGWLDNNWPERLFVVSWHIDAKGRSVREAAERAQEQLLENHDVQFFMLQEQQHVDGGWVDVGEPTEVDLSVERTS
jgi:hypothetical protein